MSTATAEMKVPSIADSHQAKGAMQKRGIGILELLSPQGRVELPLAGVSISAKVSSFVAEVSVQQTFKNPSSESLEAEYVFPLAGGCAVGHFELRVAGRVIVGKVSERGQARREYQAAIAQGKRAAILEQERSNVFTVKVGNLPPGEEATVQLTYSERLSFFEDGSGELRLPLVVAPRYMAGDAQSRAQSGSGTSSDTDKVPDASRLSPPRLAPGFDARVGLKIEVELLRENDSDESGNGETGGFDELACSQHATRTTMSANSIRVQLARVEKLDRDFVLRWRMGGASVTSSLQVYTPPKKEGAEKTRESAFALLTLVPPRREGFLGMPRDVVFVVDRSGSMQGVKMTSAATACTLLLRTLGPRDRFAVQAFDNVCDWMEGGTFVAADEAGIEKGEAFLREIGARGGTELDLAMSEALLSLRKRKEKHSGARETKSEDGSSAEESLPIIVLLTDGQVGDESSVLRRLQTSLGDVRVFTIGIDSAVNDGFLRKLSSLGGGTATFVEPGIALEAALRAVGREIGAPLITDLHIEDSGSGLDADSLAPQAMPDLFEGRPASIFLRTAHAKALTVMGKHLDGSKFKMKVKAQEMALPALAQLWAKARATELEDRFRLANAHAVKESPESIKAQIVALACEHTLLTRFTAFLAVDQEVVNKGGEGRKILQPVEAPADWEQAEQLAMPPSPLSIPMPASPMSMPLSPSLMPRPPSMSPPSPRKVSSPSAMAGAPAGGGGTPASGSGAPKSMHRSAPGPEKKRSMLKEALASVIGSLTGHSPPEADEASETDAPPSAASAEEKSALQDALAKLQAALVAAARDLKAGRKPQASDLESARAGLLKLLATFADAAQLPLLQKFLRTAAAELIAGLRSNADAKSLAPLFARHQAAFVAVQTEMARVLGNAKGPAAPAWEASI